MKQHYTKVPLFLLLFTLLIYLPNKSFAQPSCSCAGGVVPDSVVSTQVDSFTSYSTNLPVTFPKFNSILGTLGCINMQYYTTSVLSFSIANMDSDMHVYDFDYTQYSGVSGPGVFKSSNTVRNYGPYTLDTVGHHPGDSISVGPDTLFNNTYVSTNVGSIASYLGTGNVTINYDNSYSSHFLAASSNFDFQVRGYTNVSFRLAYYYCPAAALANSMTNFSALKSGNSVVLKWNGQNEQNNDNYEIQYSKDGIHFSTIGKQQAYIADSGAASKYQYQYNIAATDVEQLYFRIKKTNASGVAGYSTTKLIKLDALSAIGNFQVYPNPASKHINIEWNSLINGKISVSVLNTVGQQLYSKSYDLNGSNTVKFDLPGTIGPGLYYLLVKDPANNSQQLTKLLIH